MDMFGSAIDGNAAYFPILKNKSLTASNYYVGEDTSLGVRDLLPYGTCFPKCYTAQQKRCTNSLNTYILWMRQVRGAKLSKYGCFEVIDPLPHNYGGEKHQGCSRSRRVMSIPKHVDGI